MPLPSVTFRSELHPVVRKELDQLDSELTGYLLLEHDDDGRHTTITADAITVDGPVTITGGPLLIDGVPITGGDEIAAHAPTHEVGGTDPVTVTALAGYPGGTTQFLRGDRQFATIPPTAPTPHHLSHEPGGADALSNVAWTHLANTFTQNQRVTLQVTAQTFASDTWMAAATGYYERNRAAPMGEWLNQPFNAADFAASAGGGTWTVTSAALVQSRYTLIGKTLHWAFYFSWWNAGSNVITGTVTAITIKIPGGYSCPATHTQAVDYAIESGRVDLDAVAGGTVVTFTKRSGAAFTPGGAVGLVGTLTFEVA